MQFFYRLEVSVFRIFLCILLLAAPALGQVSLGDKVPNFTLTNQDNKRVSLSDHQGKLVVITFLFTRCPYPDKCPMINQKLGQTRALFERLGAGEDKVQIMAISLDPRFDTPEVLKAYAQGFDQQYSNYSFLTGKAEEVAKVAALFGVIYWEENGVIEHNMRTAFIAPDGKLRELVRGAEWKVGEVASKVKEFLPEK